jgi:hypothetical protein
MFKSENEELITKYSLDTSKPETQKQTIELIKNNTIELNNQINNLMLSMIQEANSDTSTLSDFEIKDNKKVCKKIMELDENDKKLKIKLEEYQTFMITCVKDDFQKQIVNNYLSFDCFKDEYNYFNFKSTNLIDALVILSLIQKNIQIAEFEILKLM